MHCARDSLLPLNKYQIRRCRGKSFLATGVTRGLATLCTCAKHMCTGAKQRGEALELNQLGFCLT